MWPPSTVRPAQVALGETDDGRRRHALQATLSGCDRAARLVDQLLTLARLEAVELPVLGDVDLGDLVRQVVADLAPAAMRKQQSLEVDAAERCIVGGDATLLAVLVRNLVDNAIRYSPADATLKMAVVASPGSVVLLVDDSGPGIARRRPEAHGRAILPCPGQRRSRQRTGVVDRSPNRRCATR